MLDKYSTLSYTPVLFLGTQNDSKHSVEHVPVEGVNAILK